MKEILAYAAQRFIEVVPEIELPGHCGAALASYPYLGCRGKPFCVCACTSHPLCMHFSPMSGAEKLMQPVPWTPWVQQSISRAFKHKQARRSLCSWKLCSYITLLGRCLSLAAHEAVREKGKIRSTRAYLSSSFEPEHAGVPHAVVLI